MNKINYKFDEIFSAYKSYKQIDGKSAVELLQDDKYRNKIKDVLLNKNLKYPEFAFGGLLHILTKKYDSNLNNFLLKLYNKYKDDEDKLYCIIDEMGVICTGHSKSAPEFESALLTTLGKYKNKTKLVETCLWAIAFCDIRCALKILKKYKDDKHESIQLIVKKGIEYLKNKK